MIKNLMPTILCLIFTSLNISPAQSSEMFDNPILAGFYPDPSICRVGSDYYLVNSTFSYFPGIPVFQSRDLVNWKQIGNVMDRLEQLDLNGRRVSEGIFAPAIRYHKGIFYVTCTFVGGGGNFIVTSKSPAGPWSDPVWIPQINGIDPSMFFDDDKAYIVYNSIPPDNKSLYSGHRTIRIYEFDIEALKVTGKEYILVNGGTDITKKPVWIEGPHIFKKYGYYYLIAAEGGTGDNHSEVVFKSKGVTGPYIPYQKNPILTQRHLDPARKFPITSTGHADFVQTESGDWWAVFLGCRPYEPYDKGYYNTGRETFLAPVRWIDGWPVINPDHEEVQYQYPVPIPSSTEKMDIPLSGNFVLKDDFNKEKLNYNWVFLRSPHQKWYSLTERKGYLAMQLRPETCSQKVNPSFLGQRQQHAQGSAAVALQFSPKAENEKAGILAFQNENHFYLLCKSLEGGEPVVELYKSTDDSNSQMQLLASNKLEDVPNENELYLKVEAHRDTYAFLYTVSLDKWNMLKDGTDAAFLSTKEAGGFVGCMYALYATSLGEPAENTAYFDWFEYMGDDEVYK